MGFCRVIGRQSDVYVYLSNTTDPDDLSCATYEECPASAFDVTLPPNAFASLYLPGLTDFQITDTNGPGEPMESKHAWSSTCKEHGLLDVMQGALVTMLYMTCTSCIGSWSLPMCSHYSYNSAQSS